MIRILDSSIDDVSAALRGRTVHRDAETERIVAGIVADVRRRGDAALLENAQRFDSPQIRSIVVTPDEIASASVSDSFEAALDEAYERVYRFHRSQFQALFGDGELGWQKSPDLPDGPNRSVDRAHPGVGQRFLRLSSSGVYVPGGNADYPSSVVMNSVPALAAGVENISVTTPARKDGQLSPAVLSAIRKCGIRRAFKIGGAAAIAALALGTESVPRVDKIVGPGNRFVNEAKRQLWGQVGLDGYAGPSEVCVLADEIANDDFAAADLLTQIEHAPDNAGFLVCLSQGKLQAILAAVERQLAGAPREATMRAALRDHSLAIVAQSLNEAIEIVNEIAPEHLTLAIAEPEKALDHVRNAGCVLLGEHTPESAGDYCLGPSHTLPTSGAARWQSPVNVLDFFKVQSVVRLSPETLHPLIPTIEVLASVEGFPTHAAGATVRRDG